MRSARGEMGKAPGLRQQRDVTSMGHDRTRGMETMHGIKGDYKWLTRTTMTHNGEGTSDEDHALSNCTEL